MKKKKHEKNYLGGCPLCGSPVLEDHKFCSSCEIDEAVAKASRPQISATIYEFPSGKVLTFK